MTNDRHLQLGRRQLSVASRVRRALWNFTWLLLFRPSPRSFHVWRCLLLRLFGGRIGIGVHPYPSARIWAPWNLEMDDHSCLADFVDCYCVDRVHIGEHAIVSQYSFLCTASHDYNDPEFPLVTAPIEISARAWVASDVFVGPGVKVGEGAVVYARSSVFKDVGKWTVAAGNPAAFVKIREITN